MTLGPSRVGPGIGRCEWWWRSLRTPFVSQQPQSNESFQWGAVWVKSLVRWSRRPSDAYPLFRGVR